ncbi:MAG: hypothetical protein Q8O19_04685, partial [Rectinemataceae bacterium]|nr:hypothetical protein [Rectinemataceae bacterium]
MIKKYALLFVFSIAVLSVHSQTIAFTSMTSSLSGTYDFYSEVPLNAEARISITGMKNNKTYPYYITVEPAVGARYLSRSGSSYKLPYTVYTMPSTPRNEMYNNTGASSGSQVMEDEFSKAESGSSSATAYHDMYLVATPGTLLPYGTYTGSFSANLYRNAFKTSATPLSKTVNVSMVVPIY